MAQQIDIDGISTASLSDTGPTRSENQDLYGDFRHASGGRLLILADGMGGHRGGAVASRSCVDAFFTIFDDQVGSPEDWLTRTFEFANERVFDAARTDPELRGMGTTAVALLFAPDGTAWVGWVGDSRLYRLRDDRLECLTEDHSLVAEWVRIGVLTPEEAADHPRRNELTRALGIDPEIEPEIKPVEIRPGDRFLLCSDGLHGVVHERQIKTVIGSQTPQEAVRSLVDRAVELGGPDNITVQIAAVAPEGGTQKPVAVRTPQVPRLPRATKIIPPMMEPVPEKAPSGGLHLPSLLIGIAVAALVATLGYLSLVVLEPSSRPQPPTTFDPPTAPLTPHETGAWPRLTDPGPELPEAGRRPSGPAAEPAETPPPPSQTAAEPAETLPPPGQSAAEPAETPPPPSQTAAPASAELQEEEPSPPAGTPADPGVPGPAEPPTDEGEGGEEASAGSEPTLAGEVTLEALEARGIDISELEPDENGFVYVPAPVPIPTAEGFELPDSARAFVDAWMQAAAQRDYSAYRALGFPESAQEFEATYGRWEAFQLREVAVEEPRTTDDRTYLRLILSYVFHDPKGRWRTEDEHRLVLRPTPDGLQYEARWK